MEVDINKLPETSRAIWVIPYSTFENVKPMNKAIIPLMNNKKATYIQPNEIPNLIVQIVENTIVLELHEIKTLRHCEHKVRSKLCLKDGLLRR